ncbi:MAG: ABC transporter ATP-binding protein [Lachnospiraceae bacterium]|nr:ABC transporter ATP-binding protein [Lachnospiraceae bacterium]
MEIHDVSKNYGKVRALDKVNIAFGEGVHGLLGENGAGKTTLMRIITTVIEQDSGTIEHNGVSWDNREEIRKMIGYLPQKFSMYKQLTVRESLRHIAILKGMEKGWKLAVDNAIESVNLEEKADSRIGELSGGMVRRLGIAQAILGNPEIIVVDEPTAGLDPEERMRFRLLLRQLGVGKTVILSTHIVDDVEAVCDNLTILHKGKVVITGTPKEIKSMAEGRIWKASLSRDDCMKLAEDKLITDQKIEDGGYDVRFVSDDTPDIKAVPAEPRLEEAYMWLIKR